MKFLTGSDYPDLCRKCRMTIDQVVDIVSMGADTDDEEAPCNFVYDHGMFCGGHECTTDEPTAGKQYALTGGPGESCIANGNTWAESEVKDND